jgi:cell division protein FtsQ
MKKLVIRTILAGFICGLLVVVFTSARLVLFTSEIFAVKSVEVRGAVHTDTRILKDTYSSYVGGNIFKEIPANTLHTEDEWVLKLSVKRVLPNKLVVLVEEDEELIRYKEANVCKALTVAGKHIPVSCEGVSVIVRELPLASEFARFAELYRANAFLRETGVVIGNGFFTVNTGEEVLVSTYLPAVFEDNFDRYNRQIKNRYKRIEKVDLTVPGKIYVKGVMHG